jgi:hypothetical protein
MCKIQSKKNMRVINTNDIYFWHDFLNLNTILNWTDNNKC